MRWDVVKREDFPLEGIEDIAQGRSQLLMLEGFHERGHEQTLATGSVMSPQGYWPTMCPIWNIPQKEGTHPKEQPNRGEALITGQMEGLKGMI